ncbi:hypothetical protein ET495_03445 [Xylanimonas allomyrinae]|uniref:Uncharacterized protein n=1 Tax=Xylanimonas allomyrinae TaxID=2509459 RepID=A0A4V0YDZ8_9MICO|nr:hypothetical protein [Xylanimonas allomyrinae]QAY62461.1 hypothetical protein ET495_03445 [Xylanimonas allomyrinae]
MIVPKTALEHIAFDAAVHAALPRIVSITDETDQTIDPADVVTLRAEVVFGSGEGWARPGMRLLVAMRVADDKVTGVFIDDGYVVSDPELVP